MTNLAIFASGSGTNAEQIIHYFSDHKRATVKLVLSNRRDAYVLTRVKKSGVPSWVFDRDDLYHSERVLNRLQEEQIDLIVLAGFLWLIPDTILKAYPNRIINIHPALLPGFGGKGMFGRHVHEAVIAAGEQQSGITIHLVDKVYDNGKILFQATCPVFPGDTPDTLAARIHELEHQYYPEVIRDYLDTIGRELSLY
ncbi:MAG: phosphoribosylglycinamide formyltransferase [Bacteroidales bacterium]|nr:phosphoribosylglycinamide formyltransferase [Bacteroidales bacterium]